MRPFPELNENHLFRQNPEGAEIAGLRDKGVVILIFRHRIDDADPQTRIPDPWWSGESLYSACREYPDYQIR